MIYLKILLIFTSLVASSCSKEKAVSKLQGDFRTQYVAESFHIFETSFIWQDIKDAMDNWLKSWPNKSITKNQLARKIYSISNCLNIDPIIYASLIFSESAFRLEAVSPTGAVGLSQFTSIGIREVNDQLGARGYEYARKKAINYFNSNIQNCISFELGISQYKHLWKFKNQKKKLLQSPNYSLIYGAIYLKSLLSVVRSEKGRDYDSFDLYKEALKRYNNDPLVREKYANRTLLRAIKFYNNL